MKDSKTLRDEFIENSRDSFVSSFADSYKQGLAEATKWIPVTKKLPKEKDVIDWMPLPIPYSREGDK